MARPRTGDRERNRPTRWRRFMDALQSNQNFEYLYWLQIGVGVCFDWTMRVMGPLLLLFATGLISMVIGMYFRFILPASAAFGSIPYMLHASWAIFLAFNVFFNYFHCAFTHPGKPSSFLPQSVVQDSDEEETEDDEATEALSRPLVGEGSSISRVNVNNGNNGSGGNKNNGNNSDPAREVDRSIAAIAAGSRGTGLLRCGYCKKCQQLKPARAHHCHVCDRCIVNMDHHCPWMNNCVGYLNYRYFVLFLLYMFVGCFYAVLITMPQFLAFAKSSGIRRRRRSSYPAVEAQTQSAVMMTFILALSVGIAISILLFWHLYLICTAQTTIEFYQNQTHRSRAKQWGELWTNPFNVGIRGNWQQVFGPGPFLLGLLPSRRLPPPPVVEFFPVEEEDRDQRQRFQEEGEWTVDGPMSANQMV
ncbi:unnamed protein product [Ascophyllum nodosum]